MRRDAGLDMLGQHFQLSGETEVPEFAAIFLIGRKMADYGYLSEESKKDKMFRMLGTRMGKTRPTRHSDLGAGKGFTSGHQIFLRSAHLS